MFSRLRWVSKLSIALIGFAAVLTTGIGTLDYLQGRSAIVDATISDLVSTAVEKDAALETWAEGRRSDMARIAISPHLIEELALVTDHSTGARGTETEGWAVQNEIEDWTGEGGRFDGLFILEPDDGEVIFSTDAEEVGTFKEDRSYYREGRAGPTLEGPYYSASLQSPTMVAAAPIRSDEGRLLGVLAGRLKLQELNAIIGRRTGLRRSDDAYLVNAAGLFVTQPRLIDDPAVLQRAAHNETTARCLAGESGHALTVNYQQVAVISAYRWLPRRALCLVVEVSQVETFQAVEAFAWQVAGGSLLGFLVAAMLSVGLARAITRPVRRLQMGAAAIRKGDLEVRLPDGSGDELGDLAREFNVMAGALKERTEELRKSAANLSDAQRIAHLGSFEWDIEQDRLFWSDEIYRILKLDKETFEPTVERYLSLIHPDDRAAVQAESDAALADCRGYDITFRILCSDGEERIIHDQAEVEADGTGRVVRMRGAFQDITEQKRAEQEQQKLVNHLRHAQRIAKLDIWLWEKRSDKIQFFGHGETIHGVPIERLQGLSEKAYYDAYLHPEDRDRIEAAYAGLAETGQTVEIETRVFDAAGGVRTIFEIGEALFDEAQNCIGNFGVLQDITDRREAERELAEKTSLLDGLVENAPAVISIKDPEGCYVHVNAEFERSFGAVAEEVKGKTAYDVFPRDIAQAQEELERRAAESEGPLVAENDLPHVDGEMHSYMTTKIPVFDPGGNPIATGTIALDITERKTAEERFRRYFDLPLVGSAIYAPDKQWIQVNNKLCELLGYSRAELTKLTWADVTHPDDLAENLRLFDEALTGERDTYSMDKRFVRKDGGVVHGSISVQCLRKPNGEPDYFILLVQDLTERRRAEEALQESEESFRQMAENIHQVLYLYEPDLSRTIYVSPAYEEIWGRSCESLYADPRSFLEAVDPEDRDWVTAAQSKHVDGDYDEIFRLVHSDGSRRWVHSRTFPVRDSKGGALRIVGIAEDITERKEAEEALRDSETSLANAQRIAHLGNWDWKIESGELQWSDEIYRIFGLEPQEFGATYEAFLATVHVDDIEMVQQAVAAALEDQAPYSIDHRIVLPDGTLKVVHEQAEVTFDAAGKAVRMAGTVQDVTEQRQAAEALRRLNEELEQRVERRTMELRAAQQELVRQERLAALGQLTGTVSHELRNPLGAMRTAIAAIKKLAPTGHPLLTSSVGIVDRSITRCDNIIGDLLDYSRVRPLELKSTEIDAWLASLLDEYKLAPGVTLRRELASGVQLAIDDDRLRRALVNVIDNACQAMVGPGTKTPDERERVLSVAAKVVAGQLEISIGDTGPGIASEDLNRIFEPLYSTKSFGVGLGLPLVKRVVEQHDGTIEVDSQPSKATCFVIRLPLTPAHSRAAS